MILFKNVLLAAVKLFCVFFKKYDIFLINTAVKYKIKYRGLQYVEERDRDGIKKGLIWIGHDKLIRLRIP